MATRLILHGRTYQCSPPEVEYSSEPLGLPLQGIAQPDPNFTDGPWGLRYRRMDRALPELHWRTMPELKALLGQDEAWFAQKVRDGELDAAMVRGSSIPLFRVLDRAAIVREALIKPLPQTKRPKRERWDKE